jgi:hypothetical protein
MQFDQARIAICERSWLDNLDLALHVVRVHAAAVATAALVGILPWALVNHLLLDLRASRYSNDFGVDSIFWLLLMVMIETPLATAPLTLYLGQALFLERPRPALIAREVWASLPQLFVFQGIVRALLIVPVLTSFVPYVLWPYLNELILLERNPLAGGRDQVSTWKRNRTLHRDNGGDFLVRTLGTMCLAPLLIVALSLALNFLIEMFLGIELGWRGDAIAFQGVVWLVTVYFTVARFLSYLDQRIRNEGWEVELFLRAQRDLLARHVG